MVWGLTDSAHVCPCYQPGEGTRGLYVQDLSIQGTGGCVRKRRTSSDSFGWAVSLLGLRPGFGLAGMTHSLEAAGGAVSKRERGGGSGRGADEKYVTLSPESGGRGYGGMGGISCHGKHT